jgi:hypothetical protein
MLTGKLAREGCRDAIVVDEEGNTTRRSMEYTEFFAIGTEPTEYCPIHGPDAHGHLAVGQPATVGEGDRPSASEPALRPSTPATVGVTATPQPPPPSAESEKDKDKDKDKENEPEKKKRGFWGRIFGR